MTTPGTAPASRPEPAAPASPDPRLAPAASGPEPAAPARSGGIPASAARSTALCVVALGALVAALVATVTRGGTLGPLDRMGPLRAWYLVDAGLFAVAVTLLRRVGDPRRTAALVLAGSVALALTGLLAPPRTSDDAYRYLWDGQVQASGTSPYRYTPTDPALAAQRAADPALFPVGGHCQGWDLHRAGAVCTHLNRPTVHTIYPPVAEIWFLGLYEAGHLTGGHGVRPAQAGGALLAVLTAAALLLVLRRNRAPLHRAAWWGWFPGVALWAVNDAHVDTLGVLLTVCGLAAASPGPARPAPPRARSARSGTVLGGVLLGAATATKLIPALTVPGALSGTLRPGRRPTVRDLVLPATAVAAFLLCYLPYVLASGLGVIGYLPGYLQEEGYDQGTRFGLLTLLDLPPRLLPVAVAAILLAAVLAVLRYGDPDAPWRGSLLVFGTALFLAAPGYPWYSLLVVALVALDGRWEWLGLSAAPAIMVAAGSGAQQPVYAAALCLVLAGTATRRLLRTATLLSAAPTQSPSPSVPLPAPAGPTRIRTASSR